MDSQSPTAQVSDGSAAVATQGPLSSTIQSGEASVLDHTTVADIDDQAPARGLTARKFYPPLQNKMPSATGGLNYDRTCIFTIAARNGFGFVDALFQSFSTSNPRISCRVWVVADRPDPLQESIAAAAKALMITVVTVAELQKHTDVMLDDLAMKYSQAEYATALKPLAFTHLFKSVGIEKAIFLDIDMWVLGPLTDVVGLLDHHSVVLCSPVARPVPPEQRLQVDINEEKSGIMNLGFVALSNTPRVEQFLSWWFNKNRYFGVLDSLGSTHFDQNWGHHVLSFFDAKEFYLVKDPRLNNIHYTGRRCAIVRHNSVVLIAFNS